MKKTIKKKKVVKSAQKITHEIVVRAVSQETPTMQELSQPMSDKNKALTIPKTWMTDKQILRMVQVTPKQHVFSRPGRGGKTFEYVTGAYVEKVLNFVFGWNWDFEVVEHGKEQNMVWVMGKLTVKSPDGKQTITKTQFGRAEIKFKKDSSKEMLDYGNDLKAATTDSLKKCASLLGIASDIYGKAEFREETGKEIKESPVAVPKEEGQIIEYLCHGATRGGCGMEMTKQENDFSVKMYGKPLCRNCQKLATPINK